MLINWWDNMLGLGLGLEFFNVLLNKQYYLEFDGTNRVDLLSDLVLPFNSGVSISIWFLLGFPPDEGTYKYFMGNDHSYYYSYIGYMYNQLIAETDDNSNEYGVQELSPPTDQTNWHNLIYIIDASGTTKWYIDGVEKGSRNIAHNTILSRFGHSLSLGYIGGLTKIARWNRVLTQAEVTQLYAGGNPKRSKAELISEITNYWDFHEGKGLIVSDIIDGNNGIRMGGATLPQWRKL